MEKKLGIQKFDTNDLELLIEPLLSLLSDTDTDYTHFFRALCAIRLTDEEFAAELGPLVPDPFVDDNFDDDNEISEEDEELANGSIDPIDISSGVVLEYMSLADFIEMQNDLNARCQTNSTPIADFDSDIIANKNSNDKEKNGSTCLEMLLASLSVAVAEATHEVDVISFVKSRESAIADVSAKQRREAGIGMDIKAVSAPTTPLLQLPHQPSATTALVIETPLLADLMAAENLHNHGSNRRKSVRRASSIITERQRKKSIIANNNNLAASIQTSASRKASLTTVKFKESFSEEIILPQLPSNNHGSSIVDEQDQQQQQQKRPQQQKQQQIVNVSDSFPTEHEIRYRWQEWLIKYRSRIITELITSNVSVPLSEHRLISEDAKRRSRMAKCNPKFNLRGWILEEICDKVAALPECQPFDAEIAGLKEELRILMEAESKTLFGGGGGNNSSDNKKDSGDAMVDDDTDFELQELLSKLKRGESIRPQQHEEVTSSGRKKKQVTGAKLSPNVDEALNQAMKILVGDIFGEISDSARGWENVFDRDAASRWAGKVPKRKDNIIQASSS
ncbi:hypothetical protein HK100_012751 [Physocladia obscura]|uniref:Selenoprotein O n=1 Tax=Physocladia obscura TaxID=109957 RepID=A0AAD5T0S4_9FUNG|nr:hypothetical protein HK100_012751 [Physocladia obscura]